MRKLQNVHAFMFLQTGRGAAPCCRLAGAFSSCDSQNIPPQRYSNRVPWFWHHRYLVVWRILGAAWGILFKMMRYLPLNQHRRGKSMVGMNFNFGKAYAQGLCWFQGVGIFKNYIYNLYNIFVPEGFHVFENKRERERERTNVYNMNTVLFLPSANSY